MKTDRERIIEVLKLIKAENTDSLNVLDLLLKALAEAKRENKYAMERS